MTQRCSKDLAVVGAGCDRHLVAVAPPRAFVPDVDDVVPVVDCRTSVVHHHIESVGCRYVSRSGHGARRAGLQKASGSGVTHACSWLDRIKVLRVFMVP